MDAGEVQKPNYVRERIFCEFALQAFTKRFPTIISFVINIASCRVHGNLKGSQYADQSQHNLFILGFFDDLAGMTECDFDVGYTYRYSSDVLKVATQEVARRYLS